MLPASQEAPNTLCTTPRVANGGHRGTPAPYGGRSGPSRNLQLVADCASCRYGACDRGMAERSPWFSCAGPYTRGMGQRPLWAPWRTEYLTSARDGECVFCAAATASDDAAARVVDRGTACFTVLNAFPYAPGHVLVVPIGHVAGLDQLADEELLDLLRLCRRSVAALRRAMRADGCNVGLNLGAVAGAGLADHLHLHVVPRWHGDTNFMPVLADTHVISQALDATRELLADALRRMA
jgi:ATP adenylyltransferase